MRKAVDKIIAVNISLLCSMYFFCFTEINAATSITDTIELITAFIRAKTWASKPGLLSNVNLPNATTTPNTITDKEPIIHFAFRSFFFSIGGSILTRYIFLPSGCLRLQKKVRPLLQ